MHLSRLSICPYVRVFIFSHFLPKFYLSPHLIKMATLTIEQKNKSLAGMKRKRSQNEKPARVVLCNPFPEYWPLIKEADNQSLLQLCEKTFIPEKSSKPSRKEWKVISKLPKETRKIKKKELKPEACEELIAQRNCLICGTNACVRGINEGTIISCIVDGEFESVAKDVAVMAAYRRIPIVVACNFRLLAKKIFRYPASVIALKNCAADNEKFKLLHEKIENLSKKFPIPANIPSFSKIEIQMQKPAQALEPVVEISDVYLYKKSPLHEKVFTPQLRCNRGISDIMFDVNADFISLDNFGVDGEGGGSECNSDVKYESARLKWLRKNTSRVKTFKGKEKKGIQMEKRTRITE